MKGYFRKRGSKWSFSIDVGRDPETGKRKQKTVSGFKTKKEAEKACAEMILQIEKGSFIQPSDQTISEFLQEWFESVAKQKFQVTTLDNYRRSINGRINPVLGHIKMSELKPVQIQKFYSQLATEGLSARYITVIHAILRSALSTAKKWELISKNVMDDVEAPKVRRRENKTWTLEEAKVFLLFAKDGLSYYYIAYMLAVYTGMRRGEVLGLRWSDVDFNSNKISIRQTLSYVSNQGLVFQEAKTSSSHRQISIPDYVIQELKRHKAIQNQFKLQLGSQYNDLDLVAAMETGAPIHPRNLTTHFNRTIKRANVSKIRFHDLRHTHATIMLQLGEHPKVVSERLGHSNIQMTMNVYSHVTPDMQKDAASRFEQAMNEHKKSI